MGERFEKKGSQLSDDVNTRWFFFFFFRLDQSVTEVVVVCELCLFERWGHNLSVQGGFCPCTTKIDPSRDPRSVTAAVS